MKKLAKSIVDHTAAAGECYCHSESPTPHAVRTLPSSSPAAVDGLWRNLRPEHLEFVLPGEAEKGAAGERSDDERAVAMKAADKTDAVVDVHVANAVDAVNGHATHDVAAETEGTAGPQVLLASTCAERDAKEEARYGAAKIAFVLFETDMDLALCTNYVRKVLYSCQHSVAGGDEVEALAIDESQFYSAKRVILRRQTSLSSVDLLLETSALSKAPAVSSLFHATGFHALRTDAHVLFSTAALAQVMAQTGTLVHTPPARRPQFYAVSPDSSTGIRSTWGIVRPRCSHRCDGQLPCDKGESPARSLLIMATGALLQNVRGAWWWRRLLAAHSRLLERKLNGVGVVSPRGKMQVGGSSMAGAAHVDSCNASPRCEGNTPAHPMALGVAVAGDLPPPLTCIGVGVGVGVAGGVPLRAELLCSQDAVC